MSDPQANEAEKNVSCIIFAGFFAAPPLPDCPALAESTVSTPAFVMANALPSTDRDLEGQEVDQAPRGRQRKWNFHDFPDYS